MLGQMDMQMLIAQILGGITVILGFAAYQMRTQKQLLAVNTATCVVFCIHYILLGAYSGFALNLVGAFRNLGYFYRNEKNIQSPVIPVLFAGAMLIAGLLSWQGWPSILCIVGLTVNSLCLSSRDPQFVRKSLLITCPLALVYNALMLSVGGAVFEGISIISAMIGLARFYKKKAV